MDDGNGLLSILVVTARPDFRLALEATLNRIAWPRKHLVLVEDLSRATTRLSAGSPLQVVKEEGGSWKRVDHLVVENRAALSDLRNLALDLVRGEWFSWVDDDDFHAAHHAASTIAAVDGGIGGGPGSSFWVGVDGAVSFYALPKRYLVFGGSVWKRDAASVRFRPGWEKGSDTPWLSDVQRYAKRRGLDIARTEPDSFVAVSHGRNLSNATPYGVRAAETVEALERRLKLGGADGLSAHLDRLRTAGAVPSFLYLRG